MSFCPRCGRRRDPDARFCGGCGHAFGQQAAGNGTAHAAGPAAGDPPAAASPAAGATRADPVPAVDPAPAPGPVPAAEPAGPVASEPGSTDPGAFEAGTSGAGEPTRWDAPVGQTRFDAPIGPTRADPALHAARPDQYASWYAEPSPADDATPPRDAPAAPGKAGQWEAGDTVFAEPANRAWYPPPAPPAEPAPAYRPPPAPAVTERRPGNRRTAALVIAAVLVALAAGGGAYALAGAQRHSAAQPPATPAATPTVQAPALPAAGASAPPAASPSVSLTPTPARTGTVRVAAGVASDAAAPRVLAYLNRYFSAINSRNYDAYQSLLDAREQAGNSRSTFDSGYATTRDSNEVLTGIEETGGGRLTANVSFTSHQSPANSVDGSACNDWQISLYLVPDGTSYVMTAAPAGYHAGYTDC